MGPCSVSVSEISESATTAVEEITTEWGETCYGSAEPYFRYHLSLSGGQWTITKLEQLHPLEEGAEMVPRGF